MNVTKGYVNDYKITHMQYYSFSPYSTTAFANNDEIRIYIQNMNAYTLLCESYIYIEVNKPTDGNIFNFTNNVILFRYFVLLSKM